MNERIKQLALQAGYKDFDYAIIAHKFAELLVRECVAICQDVDGEEDSMARCGRQDCAVEIKEHFGVEE